MVRRVGGLAARARSRGARSCAPEAPRRGGRARCEGGAPMALKEMSRREALGLGAGAAAVAGAALLPGVAGAQEARKERRRAPEDLVPRQNIGIQLYSLRDMQAASVP